MRVTATHLGKGPLSWATSIAVLAFSLAIVLPIPSPVGGQSAAGRAAPASPTSYTSDDLNHRLRQADEKIPVAAADSQSRDFKIGPDDLLNISVFEAPELNGTVRVTGGGEIPMPLIGEVPAAGLTPHQLEISLQARLQRTYLKNPHVGVFVQELQSHAVSVVGAVKMPGVFQMRGSKSLIEVLSLAEGLSDDAGNSVLLMRAPGGKSSEAQQVRPAADAAIDTRRAVVFPSVEPEITERARAAASFFNGDSNSPRENESEIVEIDLKKLLESQDAALNVLVHPGDIVKVPRAGIVYVVGEVVKPGGFVLQNNESISVLQALALAQGPTHTSAISSARIIRTDPATGARTEIPANLGRIFSGKAPDTFLQAKDVVFVPNSATKSVLYRSSEAALQTAAGVAIYKW